MSFQFGNTLFPNRYRMLEAVAYEWWTAGGSNRPEIIDTLTCSEDGLAEADEAIGGWDLDQPRGHYDEEEPSWMETHNVTREELAEALLEFWRTRPDRTEETADV